MNKDNAAPALEHKTTINWNEVKRRIESTREALESGSARSPEETRAILKKRARDLAHVPGQAELKQSFMEIVEFRLSQETYGIESEFVREVYPLKDLTPLPCTPSFVLGIVNVRGQILSIVNLKKFFKLPETGLGDLNKIIILRGEMMEFGILADVILGTRRIPYNTVQPPLPTVTGIGAEYMKGVTVDGLIVLDGDRILGDEKIIVHEETDRDAFPDSQRRNMS
jgi:purine-binding chemotaxis protein CheW